MEGTRRWCQPLTIPEMKQSQLPWLAACSTRWAMQSAQGSCSCSHGTRCTVLKLYHTANNQNVCAVLRACSCNVSWLGGTLELRAGAAQQCATCKTRLTCGEMGRHVGSGGLA